MSRVRPIARSPLGLLLLVAVAAVVLQGGSVPHTHGGPGFYNQDHDGALLATLHGVATIAAAQPSVQPVVVRASIAPASREHVDSTPRSSAASRAPPHA